MEESSLERVAGYVEIDNANLYYETAGTGEPVLFVHAGVADSRMWEEPFNRLAERYQVVRYDMRGFGRSPMPDGPFAAWRDLAAVLDAAGIEKAHIIGASMGGAVAIDFALMAPERVRSLVLAAPSMGGHEWSEAVQAFGEAEDEAMEAGDIDQAVELNLRMWVDGPARSPEAVDPAVRQLVGLMQRNAFELPMGAGRPERVTPPAKARLEEIGAPTLVLVGDADVADCDEMALEIEARVAGARRVVLPGVAHMVSMERPEEFYRLTVEFLAGK